MNEATISLQDLDRASSHWRRVWPGTYATLVRFFRSKVGDEYPDLVQRTFLGVVEGRERLADPGRFRQYLFSTAYNQLFKHLTRRHRSLDRETLLMTSAAGLGPSPLTHAQRVEQFDALVFADRSPGMTPAWE